MSHNLMVLRAHPVVFLLILTVHATNMGVEGRADALDNAAFLLMPAQIQSSKLRQKDYIRPRTDTDAGDAVVFRPSTSLSSSVSIEGDSRETKKVVVKNGGSNSQRNSGSEKTKQRKGKTRLLRAGNLPDIHWRAIPMEHLRSHPSFESLPYPDEIKQLSSLEDVRLFRQDSWQWDTLHAGRCTTSQAAAALGLLEPKTGEYLGIPRSLRKGGAGAFHRLLEPSIGTSLSEFNRVLCVARDRNGRAIEGERVALAEIEARRPDIWAYGSRIHPQGRGAFPFVAKYLPRLTSDVLAQRRNDMERSYSKGNTSPLYARVRWGSAQEATSILTALNYFCNSGDGTTIAEVGMCGATFDAVSSDSMNGLKIGATPDGLIRHADGTIEVLEVKNHCPFVFNRNSTHKSGVSSQHLLRVRDFELDAKVPVAYIPQLMMEILCLGPQCTSAVMIRQTATKGAVILRLHRDDDWIEEMKYWLGRFKSDYLDEEMMPPVNFFWDSDGNDRQRYRDFTRKTQEISENVELVDFVGHKQIQRVLAGDSSNCPLFLDGAVAPIGVKLQHVAKNH